MFGDILDSYVRSLQGRPSYDRYWYLAKQFFETPDWRSKRAAEVTRYDVLYLKQQLKDTPSQANKAIGLIRRAYSWASDIINPETKRPLYEGQNPAWRVAGHTCRSRERLMDQREIALLLNNLDLLSPKYQAFFVTRLLTPCRIKELCDMRRDAVDLETGKWFKRQTKNGRPQWTLIPIQACALLKQLPMEGDYFFMGVYHHPIQPESVRKIWSRFRKELRMTDVQLLDFRRTLSSYLYTEIKADDLTAKAVLNHYDSRPVAIYTRLNYDRLASIIQAYADWMWRLKETSHVSRTIDLSGLSIHPASERVSSEQCQWPTHGSPKL